MTFPPCFSLSSIKASSHFQVKKISSQITATVSTHSSYKMAAMANLSGPFTHDQVSVIETDVLSMEIKLVS